MKKVLFVVAAAATLMADCYGTKRVTPGYNMALNDVMRSETKNLVHCMGYEINHLSQEMSRIQENSSNASLSDKFHEAFPNTGNPDQNNPRYALQSFLRSINGKHIGLAPMLVNAIGGGDASKYSSLGTINSLQSFESKCDEYKGDAWKIKLLFAYMAETVELKSIGNIFEINPNYDSKNPGSAERYNITTQGTPSGFSVSNGYNDLTEAIQLLAYGKRLTIRSFQYNSTFKGEVAPAKPTFVQNIVQNDLKLSDTDPGDVYRNYAKQCFSFKLEEVSISSGSANSGNGEGVYLSNGNINFLMFKHFDCSLRGTNKTNNLSVYTTSKNSSELQICNLDIPIYNDNSGTTLSLFSIGKYIVFPYKNGEGLDLLTIDDSTGKLIKVTDPSKIPAALSARSYFKRPGVISQGEHTYLMLAGGNDLASRQDIKSSEIYKLDATGCLIQKTNEYKNAEFSLTYSFYNSSQTITNGTKSFLIFTERNNQGFDVYGINDSGNLYKVTAATNGGHAIECGAMPNGCVSGAVGKYFARIDKGTSAAGVYQIENMNVYTISNDGYFVKDSSIQLPFTKYNSNIKLCTTSIAGDPCLVVLYCIHNGTYNLCGYKIDKNSGKLTATTIVGMIPSLAANISSIGDYIVSDGASLAYKLVPNE